ncbi:MAG: DnaJ domain-containing protein [Acidobacteria bacterium]|nr:DnaJ domain-containing protein [Acidobacteriota bacterium]
MNGELSEHPLGELLREIADASLSGALRLSRERVKAVIYAERGAVVSARSNRRAHKLVECARRSQLVPEAKLSSAVTEMMNDAEAAAALVSAGALDAAGLAQLRARQVLDVLRPLLALTDGAWGFDPRARIAEDVAVRIDLQRLLLEGARHLPAEFAASRLADEEELISPAPAPPAHLQLLPAEAFVLSRADAPARVAQLAALAGLADAQARHTIYALTLCGCLARERPARALSGAGLPSAAAPQSRASGASAASSAPVESGARAAGGDSTDAPADPRDEFEALLARADAGDYYAMLGVGRTASTADVKRAYYALAKRFHPDRFRRDFADEETRARIENAFAEIARAYETLRDQRERATYDSKTAARVSETAASEVAAPRRDAARDGRGGGEPAPRGYADPSATPQNRAEDCFQQGLAALTGGNAAAAVAHFGEAVRLSPQQGRYHALYGRALMTSAQTRRQAEAELQLAIKLDPQNASYRVALAELYALVGLPRRAEGELERALALDPRHAAARQMLERMKGKG